MTCTCYFDETGMLQMTECPEFQALKGTILPHVVDAVRRLDTEAGQQLAKRIWDAALGLKTATL